MRKQLLFIKSFMIENCEIKFQIFMSIIFDLSQIKFVNRLRFQVKINFKELPNEEAIQLFLNEKKPLHKI